MIKAVQRGDLYALSFRYDPMLVHYMHQIPGAAWEPSQKLWMIHKNQLGTFLRLIKGTVYDNQTEIYSDEDINVNATVDSTDKAEIPDIDISDIDIYVKDGEHLFQHQIDFLKWAKSRGRRGFILADDPGAGKSLSVINYSLYMRKTAGYKHCLILCCVNVAKFSWQSDIAKHTPERSHIIGSKRLRNGKMRYNGSGIDKLSDLAERKTHSGDDLPYFLIMNIESLRLEKGAIVKQIIDMVNSGEISMIVLDECHKNMSPKSQQGKAVLEIKKKTGGAAQWISVTGTPITSKPTDVYTPLKLIDAHTFKNFWLWQQYFCVFGGYDDHEILAYRNIPELKAMLQGNMIRRLKEDVLDLPEKIRMTEYVELTPYQERMYDDIKADMLQHENEIVTSMNPLTKFLRLRQACGFPEYLDADLQVDSKYLNFNAKMRRCIELIDEIIDRGEKVVVFSQWVTPLRTLYRLISTRCKVACYTGTMDEALKEQHKRAFIENPEVKVLIGTIGAIGTSSTLVVANNLIFIDEPWNPSDRLQAEDRIHRIGATKSANIYTIIAKDTVDDSVHTILEDKELISKYIVDGVIDIKKNPELFKQLLS